MSQPRRCAFCGHPVHSNKCSHPGCKSAELKEGMIVRVKDHPAWGPGRVLRVHGTPGTPGDKEKTVPLMIEVEFKTGGYLTRLLYPQDVTRHVFHENALLRTSMGSVVTVNSDDLSFKRGLISYEVITPAGHIDALGEDEIEREVTDPFTQVVRGEFEDISRFRLHNWAAHLKHVYASKTLKSISSSRLMLLPHQVYIAHRLMGNIHPRYILADEVGLGKTIEAGIVIKELLARELAQRVLIIPPASLVTQWEFELRNKFNEQFDVLDSKALRKIARMHPGENPFLHCKKIILSLAYARKEKVRDLLTEIYWDVVVFDEAHHLRRYATGRGRYRETLGYTLARQLADQSGAMLLLTATPIQLHAFELFSLVQLLDPGLFPDYESFERFRRDLPALNRVITGLRQFAQLNMFERDSLVEYLQEFFQKKHGKVLPASALQRKLLTPRFVKLLEKDLESEHLLTRVLIRNKKRKIFKNQLPKRVPNIIEIELTPQEEEVYRKIRLFIAKIYNQAVSERNQGLGFVMVVLQKLLASSRHALMHTLQKRILTMEDKITTTLGDKANQVISGVKNGQLKEDLAEILDDLEEMEAWSEVDEERAEALMKKRKAIIDAQYLSILREFYGNLKNLKKDSKIQALGTLIEDILSEDPEEKVIIFTQFRKTLEYLKQHIRKAGFSVTTFHGGLTTEEKDRRVMEFREHSQVLVSTEIGGEGRNFQFCHILVNFDLPWNPMRVEQRIGRLDRLGQKRDVIIYNFYIKNTIEGDILHILSERIRIFEETVGGLEPILGKVEGGIQDLFLASTEETYNTKFRKFNESLEDSGEKVEELELKLSDFILDKKSFQMDVVGKILHQKIAVTNEEVRNFTLTALEKLFPEVTVTLKGQRYYFEMSPDIGRELDISEHKNLEKDIICVEGTFDLAHARENEQIEFFALGHPLVSRLVELAYSPEFRGISASFYVSRGVLEHFWEEKRSLMTNTEGAQKRKEKRKNRPLGPLKVPSSGGYLFVYQVQYRGVYFEQRLFPIFIDDSNWFDDELSRNLFYALRNSPDTFQTMKKEITHDSGEFTTRNFHQTREIAKRATLELIRDKFERLQPINFAHYRNELDKLDRLHQFTVQKIEREMGRIQEMIERRKRELPTERQLRAANLLQDEEMKRNRLERFEKTNRQVRQLEQKLGKLQARFDDEVFDYEARKSRLEKYKDLVYDVTIFSIARLEFIP